MGQLSARSLQGIAEVRPGEDVAALLHAAAGGELDGSQVLAIAHTIVSKAEGATVALAAVAPGRRARELAAAHGRDARVVQVVLDESSEVLRCERGILI